MRKIAFVTDFDGTISYDDFFYYTTNAYFKKEGLTPWKEYLKGNKSHFQALSEMYAAIKVSKKSLDKLISKIRIDKYLVKVFKLCRKKDIPIYICSAGNDYYINQLISPLINKFNITLITNHGDYSTSSGLVMSALPSDHKYFDEATGISKTKLVEDIKNQGYFVIFAGDGPPDFGPAKIANEVFARKILLQKCLAANIKTRPFQNFNNIYKFIRNLQ